jgi:hypothetical protein
VTLNDLATADIVVGAHATGAMTLRPLTQRAGLWIHDNVNHEPWHWMGNEVVVDAPALPGIIVAARTHGFKVVAE